jgi:uncharacterized membrane protein
MAIVLTGTRSLSELLSALLDRIMIPLAVIVGLSGGAMIGSELVKLQTPQGTVIH